jgi:group I intron endonuclease
MKKIIYLTTNLVNKKQYVGKQHLEDNKKDTYIGSGYLLHKAVTKYGKENFKKEILEFCETDEILNIQEIFWIKEKNTLQPNGYNLTEGGTGGDTFSFSVNKENTRTNRSKAVKKYWDNLNEKDKETRINLIRNKKRSEETCKNISKGKTGKKMSVTHKANMIKAVTEAKVGKPTYNQKAIDMYDLEGNYLQPFISIAQASKETGYSSWEICNMCKNRKNKIKTVIFKYHDYEQKN